MEFCSILLTGGAGFVGANLACMLKAKYPQIQVAVIDNLQRRGSELRLPMLQERGIVLFRGDIRCREDLQALPDFDLLIDCSAEASVKSGTTGSPSYVLNNNLMGTIHCLEEARLRGAAFLLFSTSRVYPIRALNALPFEERETRYSWVPNGANHGYARFGVNESFPLDGARSFYGTSKLASEMLVQEYAHSYGLRGIINRCGVLTGPGQVGRVEQGVVALWVARHCFSQPLRYMGFGGSGKQVRDVLHVADLMDLVDAQLNAPDKWDGRVYNVSGGPEISLSLRELTDVCRSVTGKSVQVSAVAETSDVDLRVFVGDSRKVQQDFDWRPKRNVEHIVTDICDWIDADREQLAPLFC